MKPVVADTNILVSVVQFGGKPKQLLDLALDGQVDLAISEAIIAETLRVLEDKFDRAPGWLTETERQLRVMGSHRLVTVPSRVSVKASTWVGRQVDPATTCTSGRPSVSALVLQAVEELGDTLDRNSSKAAEAQKVGVAADDHLGFVLKPNASGEGLHIELRGNLAAMLGAIVQTKRSSESDDLSPQVSLESPSPT